MALFDALSPIKAFAEVYGLKLRRGIGHHAHEYQLIREADGMGSPVCRYMDIDMLLVWIDGYEEGRKEQTPTAPKRGRKKTSPD